MRLHARQVSPARPDGKGVSAQPASILSFRRVWVECLLCTMHSANTHKLKSKAHVVAAEGVCDMAREEFNEIRAHTNQRTADCTFSTPAHTKPRVSAEKSHREANCVQQPRTEAISTRERAIKMAIICIVSIKLIKNCLLSIKHTHRKGTASTCECVCNNLSRVSAREWSECVCYETAAAYPPPLVHFLRALYLRLAAESAYLAN